MHQIGFHCFGTGSALIGVLVGAQDGALPPPRAGVALDRVTPQAQANPPGHVLSRVHRAAKRAGKIYLTVTYMCMCMYMHMYMLYMYMYTLISIACA